MERIEEIDMEIGLLYKERKLAVDRYLNNELKKVGLKIGDIVRHYEYPSRRGFLVGVKLEDNNITIQTKGIRKDGTISLNNVSCGYYLDNIIKEEKAQ